MKTEKFFAVVEETEIKESSAGKPYRRLVLKVPAFIDQFTQQKRGVDQFFEGLIFSPTLENLPAPNYGQMVECQGYINGSRTFTEKGQTFYKTMFSITELRIVK